MMANFDNLYLGGKIFFLLRRKVTHLFMSLFFIVFKIKLRLLIYFNGRMVSNSLYETYICFLIGLCSFYVTFLEIMNLIIMFMQQGHSRKMRDDDITLFFQHLVREIPASRNHLHLKKDIFIL